MHKQPVAILGAGNMGTAMAKIIAENGYTVRLWNYEGDLDPLKEIQKHGENKKYLPGVILPKKVQPAFEIGEAMQNVQVVFFVVSSGAVESVMKAAVPYLKNGMILVDVSKGLHHKTNEIIPAVMKRLSRGKELSFVGLTGPAVAKQLVEKHPAVMVAASASTAAAKAVQQLFKKSSVTILTGNDIVGGEVVQSFKNVYAIGLGIAQGLGLAFNTQAILFTLAMNEMNLLNKKMGGKSDTVYGFAGLGDFLTTALSPEGRNRRFGEYLGRGFTVTEATTEVKQTVEGMAALHCLKQLTKKFKIKLPFAQIIDQVVAGKKNPQKAVEQLLQKIS